MGIVNVKYKAGRAVDIFDQKVHVGNLHRGNQTIQTWINAIKSAERLDNPIRKALYDTYLDISIDGHLKSAVDKRVRAVTTTPFTWEGLENDKVKENLNSPWFIELMKQIMSYRFEGYTVIELEKDKEGFSSSHIIPRQNVKPEEGLVTFEMYGDRGISYLEPPEADQAIVIGKPKDFGLYMYVAPYVLGKRDNLAFWATNNELFGMPFRVYYYNPNDLGTRQEVVSQAEAQGAAAWVVLPEGAKVDYMQNQSSSGSNGGTFNTLHEIYNKEIDITVLGQTLTTDTNGKGSYALGQIHKAVEEGLNLEDRLWMQYVMNYQVKPILIKHGYPLNDVKGYFEEVERLNTEQKQKVWNAAIEHGLPIAHEDYQKEFGIPHPEEKEIMIPVKVNSSPAPEDTPPPPAQKKKSELSAQLTKLYKPFKRTLTLSYEDDLQKAINSVISRMHDGDLKAGDVDQKLFELISQRLNKALEEGFKKSLGELERGSAEYELLQALRENVFVFSGFKTYQELREASELLIDEAGKIRTFDEFKSEVLKLHQQYNLNWLQTEYNMAVANSQMAEQWLRFEEEKETAPYLKYRSVNDEVARHTPYDGIIRKVDDPIWDYLTPPLDWGCRCTLTQLTEAKQTPKKKLPKQDSIKGEFSFNPGRKKVLFPPNHPYYQVAQKDQARAEDLWNLRRPGE